MTKVNKMKKIYLLISTALLVITFTGCGTTGSETTFPQDNGNYPEIGDQQQNNNNLNSVIPAQQSGIGDLFDVASFLYAYPALNDKSVDKDFLVTRQSAQGFFNDGDVKRTQEGLTDNLGDKIINIFENNKLVERASVNETRITVRYYQNDIETATEQYRREVKLHEDMYRTENGACVYKELFDNGLDISEIIPRQANPNEGLALFGKVLHVYCGTKDGTIIDRYYADGWGTIAEISQSSDGSRTYSVLNQSSYNPY